MNKTRLTVDTRDCQAQHTLSYNIFDGLFTQFSDSYSIQKFKDRDRRRKGNQTDYC